jgi:hypothetical protein
MDDIEKRLNDLFSSSDGELFKPKEKKRVITKDERLVSQFEEIVAFYEKNGRLPLITASDFKEKLLAQRLNNYMTDESKKKILSEYDTVGIFKKEEAPKTLDELFKKDAGLFDNNGLFNVGVLPNGGKARAAGDTASRTVCKNFGDYKPLFDEKQNGLKNGSLKLIKFEHQEEVKLGGFYVCDGVMCYVDQIGEQKNVFGRQKERIHVVYENGTESNIYLRTLSSELYHGYIVVDKDFERGDVDVKNVNGYVYILKSLSKDPNIETIKDLYKIGKTDTTVEQRIKNAVNEPTYLMAPVEKVDSIVCAGKIVPERLENLLHEFFKPAQMDIAVVGNDGGVYHPDEWYSVPIDVIYEAVDLIRNGEIANYIYDGEKRRIVER